jgi:hypothetical protein
VRFAIGPGGKVQPSSCAAVSTVPEDQCPQPVDLERPAGGSEEGSHESSSSRIVRVNAAVAEVAHQQVPAERAKIGGRDRKSPRRIQRAVRGEPRNQHSSRSEHVDEAVAGTLLVIMFHRVLFCICHPNIPTNIGYVERGKSGWDHRIHECAGIVHRSEVRIEHVHGTREEVRRIEEGTIGCQSLVHSAGRIVVYLQYGLSRVNVWVPSGNSSVLRSKDEQRRLAGCDLKSRGSVENLPCRRRRRHSVVRRWNYDNDRMVRRKRLAGRVINGHHTRVIVGNPKWSSGWIRNPPSVYQVGIFALRLPVLIRNQVVLKVNL